MGVLYADNGKIMCKEYMEVYIPMMYFESNIAINKGSSIETFGAVYARVFENNTEGPIAFVNLPVIVNFMMYEFEYGTIKVHGRNLEVMILKYLKDSCVLHQSVTKGKEVAELFLSTVLAGKLPISINYQKTINMWWRNLEISGISFKVPSKIYEMVLASIYRNPNNPKERYGQFFGKQNNPAGYDYKEENVRSVVKNLSTFSGMVFEDIGNMISNGINNSIDNIEEPVSPLEKIIHY